MGKNRDEYFDRFSAMCRVHRFSLHVERKTTYTSRTVHPSIFIPPSPTFR